MTSSATGSLTGPVLDLEVPRVTAITIAPSDPAILRIGGKQQMRVVATYTDGTHRDVTREAYIESGNGEVATAARPGLITSLRRGEAPILARFEGATATLTTLTVMGDRSGFVWTPSPSYGTIDELVAAKWKRLKILPSEVCNDADFLRRASLDLTGLPPSEEDLQAFLADNRDGRLKREELVDRLVGSKGYIEYWTNKWADLLDVNRKFLGVAGSVAYRKWIREQVAKNTPYDQFAHAILTASGSNLENPPASYFKILRDPAETMENTTQLFMAVRFNCNKCHDHPFERWTQDQYYQTAAFFAQVGLKADPASKGEQLGATAVEKGKPLYEIVSDLPSGEVKHERTGQLTPPKFPFPCDFKADEKAPRREKLAAWITSPDNQYFARSYVNRLWGYLFGVGIVEPIDDIRAGNPATNPELLDYLTEEFLKSGFDARHVIALICKSRTYQLSVETNKWNEDDKTNYAHAVARRLPAEVLYDSVSRVLGTVSKFPGVPAGTRAAELSDSGVELPSGFLTTFGRPPRESACECERTSGLQLGPVMALVSGPTIGDAIADPKSELTKLVAGEKDDHELINRLFLRILNRPATEGEVSACIKAIAVIDADQATLAADLAKREAEVAPVRARQEKERDEAMATAKTELDAYEKELGPRIAEEEKAHEALIVQRIKELKEYEGALPTHLAAWEKTPAAAVEWVPLGLKVVNASSGATLTRLPDRSILASGKEGTGVYTLTAETELKGITAIRLEVLADDSLPKKGPGRGKSGNFVLNEFEVRSASKAKPGPGAKDCATERPRRLQPGQIRGRRGHRRQRQFAQRRLGRESPGGRHSLGHLRAQTAAGRRWRDRLDVCPPPDFPPDGPHDRPVPDLRYHRQDPPRPELPRGGRGHPRYPGQGAPGSTEEGPPRLLHQDRSQPAEAIDGPGRGGEAPADRSQAQRPARQAGGSQPACAGRSAAHSAPDGPGDEHPATDRQTPDGRPGYRLGADQ